LVVEVETRNLMEGSLSMLCWRVESAVGFVEVQVLWVLLDLQWSSCVVRCSWIYEGRRSLCSHGSVSNVWWRSDLCESQFAAWVWRKCYAVYRSDSTRVNGGAMSTGVTSTCVASLVRESNGTVVAKCRCSICDFLQGSMVLHRGLRHGFDEGCMLFMREHWLIFMQDVWWLYMGIG